MSLLKDFEIELSIQYIGLLESQSQLFRKTESEKSGLRDVHTGASFWK